LSNIWVSRNSVRLRRDPEAASERNGREIVYDVLYLNRTRHTSVLGTRLPRGSAIALARDEARQRRVGRMFLCGSEPAPRADMIVIVESRSAAA
jgi:hypothetical protein